MPKEPHAAPLWEKVLKDAAVIALQKRVAELEASTTTVQASANAVLDELRFLRRLGAACFEMDRLPPGSVKIRAYERVAELVRLGTEQGFLK